MLGFKECQKGNHELQEIVTYGELYDVYTVVRWCSVCGAIIVDKERDGRTYPGKGMKMKLPDITKKELW
ncbi:hypothetical protein LCGC14_0305680 [marine sediment metagenome]|uniref:Uncharacterized protein n=1 Tax=marine sediment metagenome TaxID=412755 RepID=A0A0F9TTR7_9ZZZZ